MFSQKRVSFADSRFIPKSYLWATNDSAATAYGIGIACKRSRHEFYFEVRVYHCFLNQLFSTLNGA